MAHPFEGDWRIIEMELWGQDAIDLLGPAYITFEPRKKSGQFQFIAVHGLMDCRFTERDSLPASSARRRWRFTNLASRGHSARPLSSAPILESWSRCREPSNSLGSDVYSGHESYHAASSPA